MSAQVIHEGTQASPTEQAVPAGRGRLGGAWHRIRRTVAEMNYAARRVVEVQAPWIADDQWHSR